MQSQVFQGIVDILNAICRKTGLTYAEVNIFLYCFIIPGTWLLLIWLRRPRFHALWLLQLGLPIWFWRERQTLQDFSNQFYVENTEALLRLGGGTEAGYIQISLIVGVAIPFLIWFLLLFAPRKCVWSVYASVIALNMAWYIFAI